MDGFDSEAAKALLKAYQDLGFTVSCPTHDSILISNEDPQIAEARKEIESLGWTVAVESRAYMYVVFAYRMCFGERQSTPSFSGDLGVGDEMAKHVKLTAWLGKEKTGQGLEGGMLGCVRSARNEPVLRPKPVREVDQEVLVFNGRYLWATIKALLPDERALVETASGASVEIALWQTTSREEVASRNPTIKRSRGEAAYDAYCGTRNWLSFDGKPLPKWPEVKPEIQESWEVAATAALNTP